MGVVGNKTYVRGYNVDVKGSNNRNDAGSTSDAERSVPQVKDQFCHHNRSDDNKVTHHWSLLRLPPKPIRTTHALATHQGRNTAGTDDQCCRTATYAREPRGPRHHLALILATHACNAFRAICWRSLQSLAAIIFILSYYFFMSAPGVHRQVCSVLA